MFNNTSGAAEASIGSLGRRLPSLDVRIPEWDFSDLVDRDCPICAGRELEFAFERPDGLCVRRCSACDTFFVCPAPSDAQIDAFYSNYHASHFTSELNDAGKIRVALRSDIPVEDIRISWLQEHAQVDGATVLDVGCGKGTFLHQLAKLGAETHGVEFDPAAASIAKELGASSVHVGPIETMLNDRLFDIIILKDIIEHPLRPVSLFENCVRRLKPGGLILVWTPNGANVEREEYPICLRVDLEHMQYLTVDSIRHLADSQRLGIMHLETIGHPSLSAVKLTARQRERRKKLRAAARAIPGFVSAAKAIKQLAAMRSGGPRAGNYHLFACLRKR